MLRLVGIAALPTAFAALHRPRLPGVGKTRNPNIIIGANMLGKTAAAAGAMLTATKDFYLRVIDWIERHPHWAFWLALGCFLLTVRV
jgi:hypothetical protein